MYFKHGEFHRIGRDGWLRAAVLGANDGIISTASLLIGVAAAHTANSEILIAGIAALTAGAMSMAAGEYISVKSQADTEDAEIQREQRELKNNLPAEIEELISIYIKYGLEPNLASQVATQLMEKNPLGTHVRDELGITTVLKARPLEAALFSACSFVMIVTSTKYLIPIIFVTAIFFLAFLGGLAAKIGGSRIFIGAARVTL
jgi:VIT1/CCC1 family predicted Fe2+/Mn2+ transporter